MGDYDYPEFDGKRPEPPTEPPSPEPAVFKPLQDVWLKPRVTIRRLVAFNPSYLVLPLAALSGVQEVLGNESVANSGRDQGLVLFLVLAILLGSVGGVISLYIMSFLLDLAGGALGGTAPRQHLRTAVAWASLPNVVALALIFIELMLLDQGNFIFDLSEIALGAWSLVLLSRMVAEVQGFKSGWRGLGNVLLAGVLYFVIVIIVVLVVILVISLVKGLASV